MKQAKKEVSDALAVQIENARKNKTVAAQQVLSAPELEPPQTGTVYGLRGLAKRTSTSNTNSS